jgi:glycosyltransferase involved in cell wall biosynthesis
MSAAYRILSIAHSATTRGSSRLRYWPIAASDRHHFTLVVPAQWCEYGRRFPAEAGEPELDLRILPAHLTAAGPAKWYLHFYRGLGRLFTQLRPNVVHLWEEPWSIVAVQAIMLRDALHPEAAIILETDQNILRRLPPPFEQIRRYTLRRTDALIVRTEAALAVARATGYRGPAVTVEYCVDASVFNAHGRDRARGALGEPSGLVVGYVGRLVEEKGVAKVISAIARCRSPVTLLLLGDGPQIGDLEAQARALGVARQICFLQPRPREEVAEFMRGLDVLVLLSQTTRTWKEQFGRVIMEAQACGTPVIGSDSGSIPSVVAGGGWIVGEDDVARLSALLDRLSDNPAEIAKKSIEGLAQAGRRFTPQKVAADLCEVYGLAVERRRGRTKSTARGSESSAGTRLG